MKVHLIYKGWFLKGIVSKGNQATHIVGSHDPSSPKQSTKQTKNTWYFLK